MTFPRFWISFPRDVLRQVGNYDCRINAEYASITSRDGHLIITRPSGERLRIERDEVHRIISEPNNAGQERVCCALDFEEAKPKEVKQ